MTFSVPTDTRVVHRRATVAATLAALLGLIATMLAPRASAADIAAALRQAPAGSWVRYAVPMLAGEGSPCCWQIRKGHAQPRGCKLAGGDWGYSDDDKPHDPRLGTGDLVVYLRAGGEGLDRVRAFDAECPVDVGTERVTDVADVDAAQSVTVLTRAIGQGKKSFSDEATAAIALHAGPEADRALYALARPGGSREVRKDASFWLGQTRGQAGFDAVRAMFDREDDRQLREHWVFVLSQSDVPSRDDTLRGIARRDASAQVRGQALFWMAQVDAAGIEDEVRRVLREDQSQHVRKQAIFALSQLKGDRGVPALRALAEDKSLPRELRRDALFWLAQSNDDEAFAVFDEIFR